MVDVVYERDWGDEEEETKGPYAGATTRRAARKPSTPQRTATQKRGKQQTSPAKSKRARRVAVEDAEEEEEDSDFEKEEEPNNEHIRALRTVRTAWNIQCRRLEVVGIDVHRVVAATRDDP